MLRRLLFSIMYYQRPVWDTGISPPELLGFIASHTPGRALDLGCGTGTNVVTLAKSSWKVTGVDFAPHAIHRARKKVKQSGVEADLYLEDVTRLDKIAGIFDLILDIGCFHSLPPNHHDMYINNIDRFLSPRGTLLLYVFFKDPKGFGPGVSENDLTAFQPKFNLLDRQDGTDRGIRPSAWLTYMHRN